MSSSLGNCTFQSLCIVLSPKLDLLCSRWFLTAGTPRSDFRLKSLRGCNGCEVTLLLPPRAAQMLREDWVWVEIWEGKG